MRFQTKYISIVSLFLSIIKCFRLFIYRIIIAFSIATYCYSLPTNVDINNETDVRKYAIRLSFATHLANEVYDPKIKTEYNWIKNDKYKDSIFIVMDDAVNVALNKGSDKVTFDNNGVAEFKGTNPESYTNANKNAVLLYSWIYMNINIRKTSIKSVANYLNDKYTNVDFSKAKSDINEYARALKLNKWLKKNEDILRNIKEASRELFETAAGIKITGGEDNDNKYRMRTTYKYLNKTTYLMLQLHGKADIEHIKVCTPDYTTCNGKQEEDGFSMYSGSLTEYMELTKTTEKEKHIYGLISTEKSPYIKSEYTFTQIDGKNVAKLDRIIIQEEIPHKDIIIEIYRYEIEKSKGDKTKYEVVISNGFVIQNNSKLNINVSLNIIDRNGAKIRAIADTNGNFQLNAYTDDELQEGYNNDILKEIDFYGLDTSGVTSLENLLMNNKGLTTVKNMHVITKDKYNLSKMYYGCKNLTDLPPINKLIKRSSKKIEKEFDISGMYAGCTKIEHVDLDGINFNNYNSINMDGLFYECTALKYVDLQHTHIPSVDTITKAFEVESMTNNLTINITEMTMRKIKEDTGCDDWKKLYRWAKENKVTLTHNN